MKFGLKKALISATVVCAMLGGTQSAFAAYWETEPNNSYGTANLAIYGDVAVGQIGYTDDKDYYNFSRGVWSNSRITFLPPANSIVHYLFVWDMTTGALVLSQTTSNSNPIYYDFTPELGHVYTVAVSANSSYTDQYYQIYIGDR